MPQPSTATPGSSSQLASRHGHTAGKSAWIATGSNWNPAPMAVTVSTPSVIRWRPATGRPSPPAAVARSGAPAARAVQPARWNTRAAARNRNGIDAGSSRPPPGVIMTVPAPA